MPAIYILLTRPTTLVSKLIERVTRDEFTHISLAFNSQLQPLYSFSRKYALTPLPAGMTQEDLELGFYKNRGFINCALYKIQVKEEVHFLAKKKTEAMFSQANSYHFNILGLALCKLQIPLDRDKHYFCSQFVSQILMESRALNIPKTSSLMRPADFMLLPEMELIFQGNLTSLASFIEPLSEKKSYQFAKS